MNNVPSIAQKLETALDQKIEKLEQAIESTKQNKIMDISSMEAEIGALCQNIMTLPSEDTKPLEFKMAEMISRLEDLANEIVAYQQRLTAQKEDL